ncbi:MAG: hypothetical protein ACTSVI_14445 [Promethearchaeota archaeon]
MITELDLNANPDLKVDTSRAYPVNAGQCKYCGFFKTWGFRVENPKTGNKVPGHVTKEGFKIGDGQCPYWINKKKSFKENRKEIDKVFFEKVYTYKMLKVSRKNNKVSIFIDKIDTPIRIELNQSESLSLIQEIIKNILSNQ